LILVTGASGLLGANFVVMAHRRGDEVVAASNRHAISLPGVQTVQADLSDESTSKEILRSFKPQWIVHCAALTDVDRCEDFPQDAIRINAEMSHILAREAAHIGASMIYISTDAVFDGRSGGYSEEDPPCPINTYSRSKLAGEHAVQQELPGSLIIRTNIYGWNAQTKLSLAEWILGRFDAGEPVPGFRDVMFTPILVNDLIKVILEMMKHSLKGVYHVAGAESCSKYVFAAEVARIFGYSQELVRSVSVKEAGLRAPRPENMTLKVDKIRGALPVSLPGVAAGIQHFKELKDSGFVERLKRLIG
jgi:dTDP-4-dehydrorhamnose reductase